MGLLVIVTVNVKEGATPRHTSPTSRSSMTTPRDGTGLSHLLDSNSSADLMERIAVCASAGEQRDSYRICVTRH